MENMEQIERLLDEHQRLQIQLQKASSARAQAEGRLQMLINQLWEEFKVDSPLKANTLLDELRKEARDYTDQLISGLEKIKNEYNWQ